MSDLNKDDAALQAWHAKFTNDAMVVMKRDMLIQMEEYFDHMFAKAEKKYVLVERASDMVKSLVHSCTIRKYGYGYGYGYGNGTGGPIR